MIDGLHPGRMPIVQQNRGCVCCLLKYKWSQHFHIQTADVLRNKLKPQKKEKEEEIKKDNKEMDHKKGKKEKERKKERRLMQSVQKLGSSVHINKH